MDGENNGFQPYEQMDDLGEKTLFLETSNLTLVTHAEQTSTKELAAQCDCS